MKTNQGSVNTALNLLESSAAGHFILNEALEIVWANETLERFLGLKRPQFIGRSIFVVMDEFVEEILVNHEETRAVVARAYREGRAVEAFQCHIRGRSGRAERWVEFWSYPIESGEYAGGRMEHLYDISAAKTVEHSLKLLTTAVEQGSEGVAVIKLDGEMLFANDAFAAMHGYTVKEVLGLHIQDFRVPENNVSFENDLRELEQRGSLSHESWHVKKSGERFPVMITVTLVRDASGKPTNILCTSRDITEQLQSQKDLGESRRMLATLMSNLPGMAYRCQNNPQWTMEFVSDGCLPLTGYRADELLYNILSYNDLIHVDDRQPVWEQVQEAVKEQQQFTLNYRIQTKSGALKWVWEQGRGVYDDKGELLFLEGLIADITQRKQAEEALLESEAKFRRLAETTNALIFIYQDRRLVYANPAAARATGYTIRDVNRMDFYDIVDADMREEVRRRGKARLAGEEVPTRYEVKIRTKTGESIWIDFAGTVIDYGGQPAILGTGFDITERKQAENRLRAATRELRRERQELSEKNTTLKQILEHLENERQEFKQEISQEIERSITPYLQRLKLAIGTENRELRALEDNLQAIIRKDIDLFKERYARLTPRELEICDMIRKGMPSKQISLDLSLSVATVQKHREQIRKKLAITNKSINLGSYLRSH